MESQMNIAVRDTVFNPNVSQGLERKVHVRERDGKYLYKVWIYLEGVELPYVQSVTYWLHHTFANPAQKVVRSVSNPNCQLIIWTWGLFTVRAEIEDKRGNIYEVSHELSYDKQLPKEDQSMYDFETDDPPPQTKATLKRSR